MIKLCTCSGLPGPHIHGDEGCHEPEGEFYCPRCGKFGSEESFHIVTSLDEPPCMVCCGDRPSDTSDTVSEYDNFGDFIEGESKWLQKEFCCNDWNQLNKSMFGLVMDKVKENLRHDEIIKDRYKKGESKCWN